MSDLLSDREMYVTAIVNLLSQTMLSLQCILYVVAQKDNFKLERIPLL